MEGANKLKILMVIRSLRFGGGTEKACVNVGESLTNQKLYNISYFSYFKDNYTYNHKGDEFCLGKKSKYLIFKIWFCIIGSIKLTKFCKNNNINIVVAYMGSGILTAIISKILGNKSKIYIALHRCLKDFPKPISNLFIYFLKKYSDKIIVLTEYEKNYLIKNYYINQKIIHTLPNFVDLNNIHTLCLEQINTYNTIFKNNKFTFITIGRLEKIKNQQLMVETFKKLNTEYPNTQLIILGEGKEKNSLYRIANKDIHFLGNQENVFKFLYRSDCFLLTSKSESFSIAMLEAMACNLPIISTKTQGPNEILNNGKYGILVNHDEKNLYNAMEKFLLDNSLRNHYKDMSKERVKSYQKNEIMKKWENILNE